MGKTAIEQINRKASRARAIMDKDKYNTIHPATITFVNTALEDIMRLSKNQMKKEKKPEGPIFWHGSRKETRKRQ